MKIIIVIFFYRYGREWRNVVLVYFIVNINVRDVRGGYFEFLIDLKGYLGDFSFNKF